MKILMTADTVGGVWTYAIELSQALRESGVQIALFTMGRRLSAEQHAQIRDLHHVFLYETEFKLEWMENPWQDVRDAGKCLLALENKFDANVIHLNGYTHAALPWRAPKLVVCHSCVLSWWKAVNVNLALEPQWERYRSQVTRGLQAADFVVAPTRTMLGSIKECYGETATRSAVIHNAIAAANFAPTKKQPYIFSAGRLWDPAKNISALERIAERLEWPVCAAGDELAGEPNLPNFSHSNFRRLGFLSRHEVAQWMSTASIYCAPARYEPFGLSILEAALSGCALVLGDIPSLRELWEGAAVFVDSNDAEGLKATLSELIGNSLFRDKCAARARMRAHEFTRARMASRYEAVYEALLARGSSYSGINAEARPCAS